MRRRGLAYVETWLDRRSASPEERLWQTVLVTQVKASVGVVAVSKADERSGVMYRARKWLMSDEDLETVCDLTGWPDGLSDKLREWAWGMDAKGWPAVKFRLSVGA